MSQALAGTLHEQNPAYLVELINTKGGVGNIEALQQGSSDCAFSYTNTAYEAFTGQFNYQSQPFDRLRAVALVQLSTLYFLVIQNSPIHSVADLRGRTVGFGSPENSAYRLVMLVLAAYGLNSTSVNITHTGGISELRTHKVDAWFNVAGQPASYISEATKHFAMLLPLAGRPIDLLREQYPFLRPSLIPSGTYPNQTAPIRTIGVQSLLLCRADLETDKVHEVTKAWFLTLNQLSETGRISDAVSPEVASATPIPLHLGASIYYRERQLLLSNSETKK